MRFFLTPLLLAIVSGSITCTPGQRDTVIREVPAALECVPASISRLTACYNARDYTCAVLAVGELVVCMAAHPSPPAPVGSGGDGAGQAGAP